MTAIEWKVGDMVIIDRGGLGSWSHKRCEIIEIKHRATYIHYKLRREDGVVGNLHHTRYFKSMHKCEDCIYDCKTRVSCNLFEGRDE